MVRLLLLVQAFICMAVGSLSAQDNISNAGLLDIKERTEANRMAWNKAFDEGIQKLDLSALPAARQVSETYIEEQLVKLKRLYASGDGRSLLTAVSNYLQIQKQFARDVMKSAETVAVSDVDAVGKINQRISDFAQKEKVFLIEINNAILTSPEPEPVLAEPDSEEGEFEAAPQEKPSGKSKGKKASKQEQEEESEEEN